MSDSVLSNWFRGLKTDKAHWMAGMFDVMCNLFAVFIRAPRT